MGERVCSALYTLQTGSYGFQFSNPLICSHFHGDFGAYIHFLLFVVLDFKLYIFIEVLNIQQYCCQMHKENENIIYRQKY